jgi:PAS domain S-box-containing protein
MFFFTNLSQFLHQKKENKLINELIQNAALLISLSVVYGLFMGYREEKPMAFKTISGMWFGMVAIAGMMLPFTYEPGIFYDGRSIILSLAGLFGGVVPAGIAALMAGTYRAFIGGPGVWAGLATIVSCAIAGTLFRKYLKNKPESASIAVIFFIGAIVHVIMLACQLLLPWPIALVKIKEIWIPVLLVLPVAFMITAVLLGNEEKRIKALRDVKAGEWLYRATLYSIGDAVITTDHKGMVQQMNQIAQQLTGWREKEAKNKNLETIFRILDTNLRQEVANPVKTALEKGETMELSKYIVLVSEKGNKYRISCSAAPITDTRGRILGAVLVFRDMTNEYRIQAEIEKNEKRLIKAQEISKTGSWEFHMQTGKVTTSTEARKIYGFSPGDEMNIKFIQSIPLPEYRPILDSALKNIIEGTGPYNVEFKIKQPATGQIAYIHSVAEYDKDHRVIYGAIQDITDRKQAEEKLRESENMYKLIADNMLDLVAQHEPDGKYTYISPSVKKILGYQPAELIGSSPYFLFHPEDLDRVREESHKKVLGGLSSPVIEYRIRHKNGHYIWFQTNTTVLGNEKGPIKGLQTVSRDITEMKKLHFDLLKAKEKAEESDRLKSAFLANMSHEIRTPLNGILGFTEIIADNENLPKAKRKEFSDIIQKSGENLMQLINDILDISKLDSGQIVISNQMFDLSKALKTLYTLYRKKLDDSGKRNIQLNLLQPSGNFIIHSDENRLIQVFTNLLDNAVKFTHKGEITFGFAGFRDNILEFKVTDTGIGIQKDKQEMIFNRFSQANEDIPKEYGGTGLGLSIVQMILSLLGGQIQVDSASGKGSDFTFTIRAEIDDQQIPLDGEILDSTKKLKRKIKILLTEDDPVSQLYYQEVLKPDHFELKIASTGNEALIMLQKFDPDVILMDIRLPDIDGLEVVKRIRKTGNQVKIIAQTAYAMASDEQKAIMAGCNGFLTKPVKVHDLLENLNQMIQ